jgi:lysophospholipase L1-like esterase
MLEKILLSADISTITNLVGRWTVKRVHGIDTIYSTNLGSAIKFNLSHSEFFKIDCFNNGNYFSNPQELAIRVDGQLWTRFRVNELIYLPLNNQPHQIEVMFAGNSDFDEIWTGKQGLAIKQFVFSDNAQISPLVAKHQITFVGDSITAGRWVTGKNASMDDSPYQNFVGICSDILHADATYIAYSAAGLFRHGLGGVPTTDQYLTQLDSETEFTLNTENLVVINIGTNDSIHTNQEFKDKLINFYDLLQSNLSSAKLIFIIPFNQAFESVFHEVFDDEPVILVETHEWDVSTTDQVHPNLRGSKNAGTHLANLIQTTVF